MNSQDIRNLHEAYMDVYSSELDEAKIDDNLSGQKKKDIRNERSKFGGSSSSKSKITKLRHDLHKKYRGLKKVPGDKSAEKEIAVLRNSQRMHGTLPKIQKIGGPKGLPEQTDIYDIILSHLLDEGYAETQEQAEVIMVNMSEDWRESIMEKEDSPYEKASDAALDARYGYGRATGDKRSFGRAANRSSAAAALRAIRRGERSGSGTSREAGADAVHQGWATTAKTSADQTPEKKERRAKLANTSYSNLPDDEKEKDRVSFDAVRATYNRNKTQKEGYDLYDIILSHLLGEGYAETPEAAEVIMVNMSEEWRQSILG